MASHAIAAKVPFGAVTSLREYPLVSEILGAFVTWYKKHQTRGLLLELTDDQLDDIGLTRKDIA